ncbi:sugar ABC transporter ATP-binding protein [Chelativorans sp. Marseille-P2723]|jgi:ribose transport system ATP-binding protein|uniref:sugar ABC transporter ATP-binding protein n=1 Tax=Chelativorans sp. Marseille-P2723 TaxID=2709133 RepID=UPI001FEE36B4|nr:sugar ABC transporter ATP-binding protein [Chelativorans sp. Marseille-P2723]
MSGNPGFELQAEGLRKSYGATVALEHADITLRAGEVHALLGENGAGKSTLVRILSGVTMPDAGHMILAGQTYSPRSIMEARESQVATAFQELSLVPNLSVAENVLLPGLHASRLGFVSRSAVLARGKEILSRHGLDRIDPAAEVGTLPLSERQRIEIARALENAGRVLILDEPTASLSETDWLFEQIEKARARGVAILYISHRLAEVRQICTVATVLRNGRSIATVSLSDATNDDIFEMMVGRRVEERPTRTATIASGEPRLRVSGLSGHGLKDISFEIHPGEVLGVAALEAQGQQALFRTLAGLLPVVEGKVEIDGTRATYKGPRQAMRFASGISYLPEERKVEGILPGLTAATNIVLPFLPRIARMALLGGRNEKAAAHEPADNVEMDRRYLAFNIENLSGGNQQKALMGRTLATGARTLLLFDPTRGVDVGTKQSIYAAIRRFADSGGSVLFFSSELPEIVQLSDRCLVLYGGRIFRTFSRDEINEQQLVAAMIGHAGVEAA